MSFQQFVILRGRFLPHGYLGLGLIAVFWPLNWLLEGSRTHLGFFPLWLGYCLVADALTFLRTGTSLISRDWRKYIALFLISVPIWWLFEVLNWRVENWYYIGRELFTDWEYGLLASLSFSTVLPAVFATAELVDSFSLFGKLKHGPVIGADRRSVQRFFVAGLLMLLLLLLWPHFFFPFLWLSLYLITEPLNVWLGNRNLITWTRKGEWRPVFGLWIGVLITGFFWELWNYYSFPKWIYTIPWADFWHIFEMPILGYGGYLPFSLELFALYNLIMGLLGEKKSKYLIPRWIS